MTAQTPGCGSNSESRKRHTEPVGNAGTDPLAEALLDRLHGGNEVYRYESKRAADAARAHIAAVLADDATVEAVASAAFTNGLRSVRDASAYTSGADDDYLREAADDIARAALTAVAERLGATL